MRLTPPRVVYCLGLITLIYLFVIIFASENEKTKRCDLSHEYQETLEETIGKVHKVLKKIGITHLLCYDTLGNIKMIDVPSNSKLILKFSWSDKTWKKPAMGGVWILLCVQ